MIVYVILIALILMIGLKVAPAGEFHEDILSLKVSKGIQGFCAIAIVGHHFSQNLIYSNNDAGAMKIFFNIGYLLVSVFFFFSGYGLFKSYKNKPDYMKGFLKNRLPIVLVPLYVANTIFAIVVFLTGTKYYTDGNPLCYGANLLLFKITTLLGITLMNSNAWFMITISLFYIAFYFIFRNFKDENRAIRNMGIFTFAYAVIAMGLYSFVLVSQLTMCFWFTGEWWYNSSFIFFIGMIFAKNEDKIMKTFKEKYGLLLVAFAIGTIVMFAASVFVTSNPALTAYNPVLIGRAAAFLCYVVQTISEIMFIGLIILVTMKIKFSNPILNFLGKNALEIYLIHRLFLGIFRSESVNIKSSVAFCGLVYLCTIISAVILHYVDENIVGIFKKVK